MKITKYLIGGLAALALVGCKDKMRELNTNPDRVPTADPRFMFMNAMSNFDANGGITERVTSEGQMFQYFVYYTGASDGTYYSDGNGTYPAQVSNYYNWLYSVGYQMTLLQNYIDDNLDETEAQRYQDLRAIAGIVKTYEAFRVFQNYGAAVYSQAFKAITEGITKPEYDIFSNEVYEALDDELADYIDVLAAPKNENTVELLEYDPIFGYIVNPQVGAPSVRTNYDDQRTLWKKFANSYRLYMAWIMKSVDKSRFDQVLSETKASGWYENANDGAYVYYNGYSQNEGVYNSDGIAAVSLFYSVSDNFIWYLKQLNDPRLPLLARANGLYADNSAIQWIQRYFPDSLQKRSVYNEDTKTWSEQLWDYDKVFNYVADPMLAYQGQSPNPYNYQNTNAGHPGEFWGQRNLTFQFYPETTPDAVIGPDGSWTVTNKGTISEQYPATWTILNPDTLLTISVACRPQGRYFCAAGGKTFSDPGALNNGNGYDGPVDNKNDYYYRFPLYTYPEFCFMMAYLTLEGETNTGQTAEQWYNNGVTAAMEELQMDAIRYGVQVATSMVRTGTTEAGQTVSTNPAIVGINETEPYSIADKIADYVTAQALGNASDPKEAVVGQMWIYAYNQPIKMWDWWRKTGYPEIVEVSDPASRPTGLYWMKPSMRTSGNPLEFPRRASLPQPQAINNDNYNKARETLRTTFPEYGDYATTSGRIYWDTELAK